MNSYRAEDSGREPPEMVYLVAWSADDPAIAKWMKETSAGFVDRRCASLWIAKDTARQILSEYFGDSWATCKGWVGLIDVLTAQAGIWTQSP